MRCISEILGAEGVTKLLFAHDEHYPISLVKARSGTAASARVLVSALSQRLGAFPSGRDEKKTLLTVRSARPNIQNGSLTGRKRPMIAVNTNLRKSGATYKPLEPQNNSA